MKYIEARNYEFYISLINLIMLIILYFAYISLSGRSSAEMTKNGIFKKNYLQKIKKESLFVIIDTNAM